MEDIILMSLCHYLIKGHSSYSYIAQFLGNHIEVLTFTNGHFSPENPWCPKKVKAITRHGRAQQYHNSYRNLLHKKPRAWRI